MEIIKKYSILYAEDNKDVQEEVVEYLEKYFEKVYVVDDGREALALYKKKHIDVLLLDIDMPFVDGLSVTREIRSFNKKVPIVLLTAFTDTQQLIAAAELHLFKYLVKPIVPMEFRKIIQNLMLEIENNQVHTIDLGSEYIWNVDEEKLLYQNKVITLTQKEQKLLSLFVDRRNKCVTYAEIMAKLWEDDFESEISIESVKLQVCFLRKKLLNKNIKNVYGLGYVFS